MQRPVEFPALLRKSQGHEAKIFSTKLPRETLPPPHDVTSQHRCFTRRYICVINSTIYLTPPSHPILFPSYPLRFSHSHSYYQHGPVRHWYTTTGTMSRAFLPPFLPYVKVAIQLSTAARPPPAVRPSEQSSQARREGPNSEASPRGRRIHIKEKCLGYRRQ